MVHSSPHSSAEQKNQLRGLNGLSAYPLSTSESHSEDMSVLMESKNHARLGSKPHLSVVIVKGLPSSVELGGAKPQFLTSGSG